MSEAHDLDDDGPIDDESGSDVLSLALGYAARGWHVFPVSGKHPIEVFGGKRMAWSRASTTDPERITAWYAGSSGLGIGLDCGKSGLVAFDADRKEDFYSWLKALPGGFSLLDGAFVQRGNPERVTFVFRQPLDVLGCPKPSWGEVKGAGGYIVLAGSPHPDFPEGYVLLRDPGVPAVAPDVMADAVRSERKTASGYEKVPDSWRTPGAPCRTVQLVLDTALEDMTADAAYPRMLSASMELLRLGEQEHRGVGTALAVLADHYIVTVTRPRSGKNQRTREEARGELVRAFEGAVPEIRSKPTDPTDPFESYLECSGDRCGMPPDPVERVDRAAVAERLEAAREVAGRRASSLDTELLPPTMKAAVEAVADFTETDPTLGAYMALAAASAAAVGGFVVQGPSGWLEPLALWTATAADPSERKSSILKHLALDALNAAEKHVAGRLSADRAAWDTQELMLELALDAARKALKADDGHGDTEALSRDVVDAQAALDAHRASEPEPPHMVLSEATPEALLDVMSDNRGAAAAFTAEGAFIETVTGGYGEKPSPVLTTLNSAWSAESIRSRRRGSRSVYIDHPYLVLGLCVQPQVLLSMSGARLAGSGFLARWLLAQPPSRAGRRELHGRRLDRRPVDLWAVRLGQIMEAGWIGGSGGPRVLVLTESGQELVREHMVAVERRIALAGLDTRTWLGKLVGQTLRVAGVFALIEDPDASIVNLDSLERALGFMEWAAEQTTDLLSGRMSQYGDLSTAGDSEGHRHVLAWAAKRPGDGWFEMRDFLRFAIKPSRPGWWTRPGLRPYEVIELVLVELEAIGRLESEERTSSKQGHGPVRRWRVTREGTSDSGSEAGPSGSDVRPTKASLSDGPEPDSEASRTDRTSHSRRRSDPSSSSSSYNTVHTSARERDARVFRARGVRTSSSECRFCGRPLDGALTEAGLQAHPGCEPTPGDFDPFGGAS